MTKEIMMIIDMDTPRENGKPSVIIEPTNCRMLRNETMKIQVVMRFSGKLSSIGCLEINSQLVLQETPKIVWE
jgi:hypothetical protein